MSDTTLNPYSPPSELSPPPHHAAGSEGGCFRDGKFLVIREGSILPNRCIITNLVADSNGWRKPFRVLWNPRWILWLLIGGPIIYAITIACTQKRASFTVSMGKGIRRKMAFARLISLSMLAGVVGCIYACVQFAKVSTAQISATTAALQPKREKFTNLDANVISPVRMILPAVRRAPKCPITQITTAAIFT